jgi:heptosyltransferase-3
MNKTLLFHQGALGDLILSLPAIQAIRCGADTGSLHLISRADLQDLLLHNGLIDETSSIDSGFFAPLYGGDRLPETLKNFLMEYSSAFVFSKSPDLLIMERVAQYVPRSFHIRTVPPAGEIVHVSDFQLSGLRSAGLDSASAAPVLDAVASPVRRASDSIIVFHPGSGGRGKCWSLENYLDLIAFILKSGGYSACVLVGPAEGEELFQSLLRGIDKRRITVDIVRDRPISHIASLLKSSTLYVGNDSGVTHLSSALGVPTVALFGPTDHRLWRPKGKKTRIVRSDFPCSPCDEERCRRCGGRNCLETIGVGAVIEEIRRLIGDGGAPDVCPGGT